MENRQTNKAKYLYRILVVLLAWCLPLGAMAQEDYLLKGNVADEKGETMPGVNILIKGTVSGVATDLDGNFTLKVKKGDLLVFSFTGYKTQEIPVVGQNDLKIVLQEDIESLEEVVVIGYGTLKKSDLTGAITSVDAEKLAGKSTVNVAEALQGQVAGVSIAKYGGLAGQGDRKSVV